MTVINFNCLKIDVTYFLSRLLKNLTYCDTPLVIIYLYNYTVQLNKNTTKMFTIYNEQFLKFSLLFPHWLLKTLSI